MKGIVCAKVLFSVVSVCLRSRSPHATYYGDVFKFLYTGNSLSPGLGQGPTLTSQTSSGKRAVDLRLIAILVYV